MGCLIPIGLSIVSAIILLYVGTLAFPPGHELRLVFAYVAIFIVALTTVLELFAWAASDPTMETPNRKIRSRR